MMKKLMMPRMLERPDRFAALTALTFLLISAAPQTASAQLLAYEGFDYYDPTFPDTFPNPADGSVGGGTGWADGWVTGDGTPSTTRRIVETGLTYTDSNGDSLQTESGAIELINKRFSFDVRLTCS